MLQIISKWQIITCLILCFVTAPLLAADCGTHPVLTGSGTHLPVPVPNSGNPNRVAPLYVPVTGTPFTGTWSAPAHVNWHGAFTGTGLQPGTSGPGPASINFSGMTNGFLPVGSIITLGDLDAGSDPNELITLQAFNASLVPLSEWLDEPCAVNNAGSSMDTPAWDWNAATHTYTFSGNVVPGNPSVAIHMKNNQEIHSLEVFRGTDGVGYAIDAPATIFCDGFESGDTAKWDGIAP